MSSHSRFWMLCVLFILYSIFDLAAADGSTPQLRSLFQPIHGQRDVSGCDEDFQNLEESYSEAISLTKAAIAALSNIEDPRPEDSKSQEWDRQARMAKAMFNIEANPTSGITDRNMAKLVGDVKKRYNTITRRADKQSPAENDKRRLFCTPNVMMFVGKGLRTPWGVDIGGTFPNGAFVWKISETEVGEIRIEDPNRSQDPEENICLDQNRRPIYARVFDEQHMLMWCETGLQMPPTLGKDAREANARIAEGQELPFTMSVIWMHEMMHVWTDQPKVIDQPLAERAEDGTITMSDKFDTYGFDQCATLAMLRPDDAPKNADSYQIFATAVWLNGWDWSTEEKGGKAVKLPDA